MKPKFFLFTAALLAVGFFAFVIIRQQNQALKRQVAYLETKKS